MLCVGCRCTRQDKHRGVCNKAALPKTGEQAPVKMEAGELGNKNKDTQ